MRINSYSKSGGGKHNPVQGENKFYRCVQNTSRRRNTFGHLCKKVKISKGKEKWGGWKGHYPTVKKMEIIILEEKANFFSRLLNNAAYRTTLN